MRNVERAADTAATTVLVNTVVPAAAPVTEYHDLIVALDEAHLSDDDKDATFDHDFILAFIKARMK